MPSEEHNAEYCLLIKGAPMKIWGYSSHTLINGEETPIGDRENKRFMDANKKFAKNGERVLGFAMRYLPRDKFPKGHNFNVKSPDTYDF